MDLDFANYIMDRAINVADKFHFYEIKVDFLKDILWLFEHVTEHCKIENSIGYNAGIYYCEGIKMVLKFANKFKNSILGTEVGVTANGFSNIAILATIIAVGAVCFMYMFWRV